MNYFVFVVCGAKEHIDTLNYSLKFVRHFSRYPVLVVTDTRRNDNMIEHDRIIDIKTPDCFDNHQASIYLKTGLHKFLNLEENSLYCYLDSDVVAISEDINTIFDCFTPPIIFARDHCNFDEFSPHAMNCGCLEDVCRREREYKPVDMFFRSRFFAADKLFSDDRIALDKQFEEIKGINPVSILKAARYVLLRYFLPVGRFRFGKYLFDKKERFWYNTQHEIIHIDYRYYSKKLKRKTGAHYDYNTSRWLNRNGEDITPSKALCSHLSEHIAQKYGIEIPGFWRHWNGGVFIFGIQSVGFLEFWHNTTIDEFNDRKSKTRDQGMLALTVWKYNLQNNPVLTMSYNFITEFRNENIAYDRERGFTADGFNTVFNPCFLHIYHEWEHKGWSIWDFVEQLNNRIQKME